MIQWFAKKIEQELNDLAYANGIARTFKIYADAGERPDVAYDPADERNASDIEGEIYGIFDAQPSRMAPIPGVTVLSINGTLTVFPEIKLDHGVVSGQFKEEEIVENLLESFSRANNGKTYSYPDDTNPEFNVSVSFSPVVGGDWELKSTAFGETIPLSMSVYLTAVQRGVSSNDVTVYIDGYPIFYESFMPARQKTLDQFTYKDDSIKSVVVQHALTMDITFPLLKSKICDALLVEILDGAYTVPHSVVVKYPTCEREYLCVIASCNAPAKPGQNVGMAVSFAEAKRDIALAAMGTDLSDLGDHFRKKVFPLPSVGANKPLTAADISDQLIEGKMYACAVIMPGGARFLTSFKYTPGDVINLTDPELRHAGGGVTVRLTYGE